MYRRQSVFVPTLFSNILAQEKSGIDAVHEAVKRGVNYFDVSPYYGRGLAEKVLGKALKPLPRDSFVVSTKVGRYDTNSFDFSADRVTRSVDESLERLGLDYIDMILCHDIEGGDLDQVATETIPALLKLKESGKVRAVGITGYPLEIFPYVLAVAPPGSVDVVLSYCNYNLQNTRLNNLLPALKREGVGIINASPLCMGLLTPGGGPEWHPAPENVKVAAREASDECKRRGIDLPGLALRFALGNDDIASTLVGVPSTGILDLNLTAASAPSDQDAETVTEIRDGIFACHKARNVLWNSLG